MSTLARVALPKRTACRRRWRAAWQPVNKKGPPALVLAPKFRMPRIAARERRRGNRRRVGVGRRR
eukprot:scaffold3114_cov114-Isochrysis_galbana.AAC.3